MECELVLVEEEEEEEEEKEEEEEEVMVEVLTGVVLGGAGVGLTSRP